MLCSTGCCLRLAFEAAVSFVCIAGKLGCDSKPCCRVGCTDSPGPAVKDCHLACQHHNYCCSTSNLRYHNSPWANAADSGTLYFLA